MNCEFATKELVECARRDLALSDDLAAHVAGCESCGDRWDAERDLTSHLRALRLVGEPANAQWGKAVLLRQFDAHRRHERQVRWMWAMSSAAVLLLSVGVMRDVWMKPTAVPVPAIAGGEVTYPMRQYPQESFAPAEEAGERGFIKVPFALPPV